MPKTLTPAEKDAYWTVVLDAVTRLEQTGMPYHVDSSSVLFVHGIDVYIKDVDICVPCDQLAAVHEMMREFDPEPIKRGDPWHDFHVHPGGIDVHFLTTAKMTAAALAANPDQVRLTRRGVSFWSLSVDWCRRHIPDGDERAPVVDRYLAARDGNSTGDPS